MEEWTTRRSERSRPWIGAVAETGRIGRGSVTLGARYLAHVAHEESSPENQSGADKTWLDRAGRTFRTHYARARRL
jgi:hypothetical protein